MLTNDFVNKRVDFGELIKNWASWELGELTITRFTISFFREEGEKFFSTVRPEEIPDVPEQKFLYRGSPTGKNT